MKKFVNVMSRHRQYITAESLVRQSGPTSTQNFYKMVFRKICVKRSLSNKTEN